MSPQDVVVKVSLNNIGAVAERKAAQSQAVGQASRSAGGASSTNEQTQTGAIEQNAVASNSKDIRITPPSAGKGPIEHYTVSLDVSNLFASANGAIWQGQGGVAEAGAGGTVAQTPDGDTAEISPEAAELETAAGAIAGPAVAAGPEAKETQGESPPALEEATTPKQATEPQTEGDIRTTVGESPTTKSGAKGAGTGGDKAAPSTEQDIRVTVGESPSGKAAAAGKAGESAAEPEAPSAEESPKSKVSDAREMGVGAKSEADPGTVEETEEGEAAGAEEPGEPSDGSATVEGEEVAGEDPEVADESPPAVPADDAEAETELPDEPEIAADDAEAETEFPDEPEIAVDEEAPVAEIPDPDAGQQEVTGEEAPSASAESTEPAAPAEDPSEGAEPGATEDVEPDGNAEGTAGPAGPDGGDGQDGTDGTDEGPPAPAPGEADPAVEPEEPDSVTTDPPEIEAPDDTAAEPEGPEGGGKTEPEPSQPADSGEPNAAPEEPEEPKEPPYQFIYAEKFGPFEVGSLEDAFQLSFAGTFKSLNLLSPNGASGWPGNTYGNRAPRAGTTNLLA